MYVRKVQHAHSSHEGGKCIVWLCLVEYVQLSVSQLRGRCRWDCVSLQGGAVLASRSKLGSSWTGSRFKQFSVDEQVCRCSTWFHEDTILYSSISTVLHLNVEWTWWLFHVVKNLRVSAYYLKSFNRTANHSTEPPLPAKHCGLRARKQSARPCHRWMWSVPLWQSSSHIRSHEQLGRRAAGGPPYWVSRFQKANIGCSTGYTRGFDPHPCWRRPKYSSSSFNFDLWHILENCQRLPTLPTHLGSKKWDIYILCYFSVFKHSNALLNPFEAKVFDWFMSISLLSHLPA